jgi:hypothetical protein
MKNEQVITYVPQEYEAEEMGGMRRAAHFYANKLGQEFTLLLFLCLAYQSFLGVFVGIRSIRYLPVFSWLPQDNPALNVLAVAGGIILGLLFQALLIAWSAQFAWIYRPDRLRNQLMQTSRWWWLIGIMLVVVIVLDFGAIFLSITGTTNLSAAVQRTVTDNMTIIINLLFMVLTLLTLLQCAVTMRTTTVDYNRKLVEEHIRTIGEELFLGSGEALKEQAEDTWRKLNADPARFIPLQDAVMKEISRSHPEMFSAQVGGDTWAYDTGGNALVALPPDLHQALNSGRARASDFSNPDMRHLWQLGPADLSRLISYNMTTMGKPRIVDATDPGREPEFLFQPPNFAAAVPKTSVPVKIEVDQVDPLTTHFADPVSFWEAIPKKERVAFYGALQQVYQNKFQHPFYENAGVRLYEEFSVNQLRYFYEQFQSRQRH